MTIGLAGFAWDEESSRYRDLATGRFVGRDRIARAMNETLAKSEARVRRIAGELQSGRMSVDTWAVEMRREIKTVHLWQAASARGGWAQMDAADFGRVGQIVRRQYEYLYRFAGQITGGLPLDGRFVARALMYVEAGRGTREHFDSLEHGHATEERNILGAAEHCPDCLRITALGWYPKGTQKPPGQRQCRSRCKCRREFR